MLFIIDWWVEGKFYSIFSILFGIGCALQYERFGSGSMTFRGYWLRRMLVLLVIGQLHMLFVWNGDILTVYSVLGMLLLLFIGAPTRVLVVITAACLLLPIVMHVVVTLTQDAAFWGSLSRIAESWKEVLGYAQHTTLEMRTSNDPREVMYINLIQSINRPMSYLITGRYVQVLGMFLIGVLIVRALLARIRAGDALPAKMWLIPGSIGLVLSFIYALIKSAIGSPYSLDTIGMIQAIVYHINALLMSLGIAFGFYHMWLSKKQHWFMQKLSILGRMPLSKHILQNVIAVILFVGYGFALMDKVPYAYIPLVAVLIFAVQIWFSSMWLSRFSQGPLEMVWKTVAYRS